MRRISLLWWWFNTAFLLFDPLNHCSVTAAFVVKHSAGSAPITILWGAKEENEPSQFHRRNFLSKLSSSVAASTCIGGLSFTPAATKAALAFPNRVSDKYQDRPKTKGPKPKDIGVSLRKDDITGDDYLGLKHCGTAPNCFCSTDNSEVDPEHVIPSWKFPSSRSVAFDELKAVLEAYPPGQSSIDGGGFQIQTADASNGYIYVQYQSLKAGYIDDVEFAFMGNKGQKEEALQVRSSSRLGYLDFGVNAKRLNYIAGQLRKKGWNAPGVDFATHPDYAAQNGVNM